MNDKATLREDAGKDSETLEREINQTRDEMNRTLDSLERKLTAGQLLDQCLKFFGKTGSEIGSSIGNCVKENPMPVVLTATGIAWMIFGSGSGEDRAGRRHRVYDDDRIDYSDQGYLVKIGETLESGATAARSQLAGSKDAVKDRVSKSADTIRESVDKTTDRVKETVKRTTNAAQVQAERAREGFTTLLEEQPLILGALGIALGAAIGAALPSTDQEDRLLGEMRDKTMEKAKQLGGEAYEKGRQAAEQGVESIAENSGSGSTARS
jgi:hypothetical protein